jgi:hypothetical protein
MKNTQTTLPIAILSFAFTGVFGPHRRRDEYIDPPRTPSQTVQNGR